MASDAESKDAESGWLTGLLLILGIFVVGVVLLSTQVGAPAAAPTASVSEVSSSNINTGSTVEANFEPPPQTPSPPPPTEAPTPAGPTEAELVLLEERLREDVRKIKSKGTVMETDANALEATGKLQEATRKLLFKRYGQHAKTQDGKTVLRLKIVVEFPQNMPDLGENGETGVITVETAPFELMPHAVFVFLENLINKEGGFFRNAGHVLQVNWNGGGLAFQEYSPQFPHEKYTLGFAGRPGGPQWYISTVDNTRNHGPASQGSKSEADSCFGKVLHGKPVVDRLLNVWGRREYGFKADQMGFLSGGKSQHAIITQLSIEP